MSKQTASLSPATSSPPGETARGFFYLTLGKLFFLASRMVFFLGLPRFLSGPAEYGNFVLAIGIVLIASTMFLDGTTQAVSKLSAEDEENAPAVRTAALLSRLWIASGLGGVFALLASPIAHLLRDETLVPLLRLGGLTVVAYAFFAVFLGYANGTKKFARQSIMDMGSSLLKPVLVLGAAGIWGSAYSALAGFTLAQALGAGIGLALLGVRPWKRGYSFKKLFHYETSLMGFSLVLSVALRADLFLLKGLLPPAEGGEQAGLYGAAQIFAQVPNALAVSLNFLLLPLVSGAVGRGKDEEARRAVRMGLLLGLIILAGSAAVFSGSAELWIALFYPAPYAQAAPALEVLAFGGAAYSLLALATTALTASGRPRASLLLAFFYLAAILAAGFLLVPRYSMRGAAWTHLLAGLLAAMAALFVLRKTLGAALPPGRSLAVLLAAALSLAALRLFPESGEAGGWDALAALLPRILVQGAVFVALLFLLRAVRAGEVRELLRRRREAVV
ncbi:MAG: oligosaccharide flippase family protein [Bdellovibrionota bacterium]